MGVRKINLVEARMMRKAGKKLKEIADHFGTSVPAVSKALGELSYAVIKSATMEAGHEILSSSIDAADQLFGINQKSNLILDGLMKEIATKGRTTQERQKVREVALKACQEIRGQLSLQLEIFRTLTDVTAIADFQKQVITVIGEANKCPECGGEIFCGNCFLKSLSVSLDSFGEELKEKIMTVVKSVPKAVIDLRAKILDAMKRARALRSGVTFKP